jgi:hypothetical protein
VTGRPSIVEFLRARLDEEEQVAREVIEKNWHRATWVGDEFNSAVVITRDVTLASGSDHSIAQCGVEALEDGELYAEHIAQWDPARVLAEVDARRRIIEMWEDPAAVRILPDGVRDGRDPDEVEIQVGIAEAIDDVVCVLAMPYAGHPDYDQAWAPEQVAT